MRVTHCLIVAVLVGCSGSHAADAGSDASTAMDAAARDGATGGACVPELVPAGGFHASDVYVETPRPDCEDGACAVYHLQGDPRPTCTGPDCADPSQVAARMFCSCRCAAPDGVPGPFCSCPAGMICEELLSLGATDLRGSYCVPSGLLTR